MPPSYKYIKHSQNAQNSFAWVRTTQTAVQAKQPDFHNIKRRTLTTVYRCIYFSISELKKKLFKFEKLKNNQFFNNKSFYRIYDIEKLKTTLHSQCSSLCSVKIWLPNLDYSLSGSYSNTLLPSNSFVMFYIFYKTGTTHAGVESS